MAANVTPTTTAAQVTVLRPRVSVSVFSANAEITAPIAATDIAYIALNASAILDASGRYMLVLDSVNLTDGTSVSLNKVVGDSFSTTDTQTVQADKGLGESIELFELFIITLVFLRDFQDSFGITDSTATALLKAIEDAVSATDAAALSFSKAVDDSSSATDAAFLSVQKTVDDAQSVADAASLALSKLLTEIFSAADDTALSTSKPVTDTIALTEAQVFQQDRVIADGVAMNDGADVSDGIAYESTKSTSNIVLVPDSSVTDFIKSLVESASTADSGLVISQGYAGLDYFLEDYVGEARTF